VADSVIGAENVGVTTIPVVTVTRAVTGVATNKGAVLAAVAVTGGSGVIATTVGVGSTLATVGV